MIGLVTAPFCEEDCQRLRLAAGDAIQLVFVNCEREPEQYQKWMAEAEIVIGGPTLREVWKMPRLRWLQMTWAGTEQYTADFGFPEQVQLTNVSGAFGGMISEYVIGAILAVYRRFPRYYQIQGKGLWQSLGGEQELYGKTALILGAGDIGQQTAARLKAFGVSCLGIWRVQRQKPDCFEEMGTLKQLDEWLPRADLVIGCLPATTLTAGLLQEERLRKMKRTALLVNVGRGKLIVTEDLVRVLESGHLSGAVLDVTDPEPLPSDHPLRYRENVLLTPHISGKSFGASRHTEELITQICCENLKRYSQGRSLKNQIDWSTTYRRLE